MKTTITELNENDKDVWKSLWREYLVFYKTELPDTVYESTWSRLLSKDHHEFNGFAARNDDGRIVGITHFLFHRSCWTIENVCYLQDLFVEKESRGQGIARQLIESVYAKADETDQSRVYWMTQDFNTQARYLYDNIATLTPFIKYARP